MIVNDSTFTASFWYRFAEFGLFIFHSHRVDPICVLFILQERIEFFCNSEIELSHHFCANQLSVFYLSEERSDMEIFMKVEKHSNSIFIECSQSIRSMKCYHNSCNIMNKVFTLSWLESSRCNKNVYSTMQIYISFAISYNEILSSFVCLVERK